VRAQYLTLFFGGHRCLESDRSIGVPALSEQTQSNLKMSLGNLCHYLQTLKKVDP
jgi:hypothetical protein